MSAVALNSSVLVLNRFFSAVHVVSARRAFALLYKQTAEVVHVEENRYNSYDFESWVELSQMREQFRNDGDHHDWVRAVSFQIMVPRIIRLLVYDRLPPSEVKFNRQNIYARDENLCQYCGKLFPSSELSIDHVVPRSRGGKSTWRNVVCACLKCNVKKGGRLPQEAGLELIHRPRKPRRSPVIKLVLRSRRYQSWKRFLDAAYWTVELKE